LKQASAETTGFRKTFLKSSGFLSIAVRGNVFCPTGFPGELTGAALDEVSNSGTQAYVAGFLPIRQKGVFFPLLDGP
jgi:hypothetical protein